MIAENLSLKAYNTFGIDVNARYFSTFDSVEKLKQLLLDFKHVPLLVLGGGSNILLTKHVDGLVLRNEIKGIEIIAEGETEVIVKVGAGEIWHEFVLYCIDNQFAGVENLSLIPGSVGASPMQNIGAYGVEIKHVFDHLEALEIETGEIHTFDNAQCEFGYRESVFKRKLKGKYIILTVSFKLSKQHSSLNTSYGAIESELAANGISSPTLRDISNAVIAIRQSKLPNPAEIGNAGSFFKNPVVEMAVFEHIQAKYPTAPSYPAGDGKVKMPAGWLIETAGWKGKLITKTAENLTAKYGVHKNQALVLVNYGGATGVEIFELSSQIIQSVENQFGIQLEREVNLL